MWQATVTGHHQGALRGLRGTEVSLLPLCSDHIVPIRRHYFTSTMPQCTVVSIASIQPSNNLTRLYEPFTVATGE